MRTLVAWLLGLGLLSAGTAIAETVEGTEPQAAAPSAEPAKEEAKPAPLSFKIGSTEFAPLGFMDLTGVYRSENMGGVGTSFGAVPFSNTPAGQLGESRFSPQNSRLGMKVSGKWNSTDYAAYLESDFLGFQVVNSNVTSNSFTFRMRLYFAQFRNDKVEVVGGQAWSLLTPNRKGISPYTSDVFYGSEMDTNYLAGLTWTRAPQIRLTVHPSEHVAFALAAENPEQYIGGAVVLPSLITAYKTQLDDGTLTSTPNVHPDLLGKLAIDGDPSGHHLHVEAVGVFRTFKVYNPANATSSTATGTGGSVNVNLEIAKNVRLIGNTFFSNGGGRYIFGLAPDLIANGDGSLKTVTSKSAIAGFEALAGKTLIYGYYSGLWIDQATSIDPATKKLIGFGFAGGPTSANHKIEEYTFGINPTIWKDANHGAVQIITQYSYLKRTPWAVPAGTPADAHVNLFYADLRFVLP